MSIHMKKANNVSCIKQRLKEKKARSLKDFSDIMESKPIYFEVEKEIDSKNEKIIITTLQAFNLAGCNYMTKSALCGTQKGLIGGAIEGKQMFRNDFKGSHRHKIAAYGSLQSNSAY